MVPAFCLRLAFGLLASLAVLKPSIIPPRFFRVHFLTALALVVVAAFFLRAEAGWAFWLTFALAAFVSFVGSIVWHVDEAPGGNWIIALSIPLHLALLVAGRFTLAGERWWMVADDVASSLVIGAATTAMLMGHSYLISPHMSITPLLRLIGLLGVALVIRGLMACIGLWLWTGGSGTANLDTERTFWLAVRWGLGVFLPAVLGWMAWETARIRSTQSATGILYVVVIVCFLGELASMQLLVITDTIL